MNDIRKRIENIKQEILSVVEKHNVNGFVIDMTGDVQSLVAATFVTLACGTDNVYGVILPYLNGRKIADADDVIIAEEACNRLLIDYTILPVDNVVNMYRKCLIDIGDDVHRVNNIIRTTRKTILQDFGKKYNYLVIGAGLKYMTDIDNCGGNLYDASIFIDKLTITEINRIWQNMIILNDIQTFKDTLEAK